MIKLIVTGVPVAYFIFGDWGMRTGFMEGYPSLYALCMFFAFIAYAVIYGYVFFVVSLFLHEFVPNKEHHLIFWSVWGVLLIVSGFFHLLFLASLLLLFLISYVTVTKFFVERGEFSKPDTNQRRAELDAAENKLDEEYEEGQRVKAVGKLLKEYYRILRKKGGSAGNSGKQNNDGESK